MIVNGEYQYVEFEDFKDALIEGFVEYYGEDYRKIITRKINSVEFYQYQEEDYIYEYYNKYMLIFKNDIINEFYKICKENNFDLKRSKESDYAILDGTSDINDNAINIACEGYPVIEKDNAFTAYGKRKIKNCRELLDRAFGIDGKPYEKLDEYKKLREYYLQAVKNIENQLDSSVIKDFHQIEDNKRINFSCFLKDAYLGGYKFTLKDLSMLYSGKVDFLMSTYLFDSNKILFDYSLECPGFVSAFTTEVNEVLKGKDIYSQTQIKIKRIRYCLAQGGECQFLDDEYLRNLQYSELTDVDIDFVNKEYEYQKNNFKPKSKDYELDEKILAKNIKNGQFFPEKIADHLEKLREAYAHDNYENCSFKFLNGEHEFGWFSMYSYDNDDITMPTPIVVMKEDECCLSDYYMRSLVHEFNHVISYDPFLYTGKVPFSNKNYTFSKSNIHYYANELIGKTKYDKLYNNDAVALQEYINERQAKEIYPLVAKRFNFSQKYPNDKVLPKKNFECLYNYMDPICEEFYDLFHDELKLQNVDPEYDMCFIQNIPLSKFESVIAFVENKVRKNILKTKFYGEQGCIDLDKLNKFASIVEKFYNEIIKKCTFNMSPQKFSEDTELKCLPEGLRAKANKYVMEAKKIVEEMRKDKEMAEICGQKYQSKDKDDGDSKEI